MPKKKVPYVHSNFERVPGDYYPTIDPRCVDGLLEIFPLLPWQGQTGASFDVCAPEGSGREVG